MISSQKPEEQATLTQNSFQTGLKADPPLCAAFIKGHDARRQAQRGLKLALRQV